MDSIAIRLKKALELRNMTQADLVKKTGIGKSSISTYISGEYEPKQKNTYKLAKALNVNEAWLMGLDVDIERRDNVASLSDKEMKLLKAFNCLNDIGKNEAQKRVEELTLIDKYSNNNDTNDEYITIVAARGNSELPVKLDKKSVLEDLNKPMSYDD
ncbi:MAG: helix-turn-helix domain-containing protein [Clostridia bacterium]|nr:helix-turn-helix domain-containing protein [Clostridia bacterium]